MTIPNLYLSLDCADAGFCHVEVYLCGQIYESNNVSEFLSHSKETFPSFLVIEGFTCAFFQSCRFLKYIKKYITHILFLLELHENCIYLILYLDDCLVVAFMENFMF